MLKLCQVYINKKTGNLCTLYNSVKMLFKLDKLCQ